MTKLLQLLDGLPGWFLPGVIVFLCALAVGQRLELAGVRANAAEAATKAAKAVAQCATDKANANAVAAARVAAARASDAAFMSQQTEVIDVLQKNLSDADERSAGLAGRLRQLARPLPVAGGRCGSELPQAAAGGDGQRDPGLPGLAGADLVVLDGEARADLARFATSAHDAGETLKACRKLLRQQWQATQ
jgi:hypothetical protein